MEGRNHCSTAFTSKGIASRIEIDLMECLKDLKIGFRPRAAIRERSKDIHIRVIGAGLAGLRCAKVLVDTGVKVMVLEARERIGSRVS